MPTKRYLVPESCKTISRTQAHIGGSIHTGYVALQGASTKYPFPTTCQRMFGTRTYQVHTGRFFPQDILILLLTPEAVDIFEFSTKLTPPKRIGPSHDGTIFRDT